MARIKIQLADQGGANKISFEAEGSGEWVVAMSTFVGESVRRLADTVALNPYSVLLQDELDAAEVSASQGKNYQGTMVRATITEP